MKSEEVSCRKQNTQSSYEIEKIKSFFSFKSPENVIRQWNDDQGFEHEDA